MIGSMTNIRLPTADFDDANALQARLYETRGMYMVVVRIDGQPWTRLSAQVKYFILARIAMFLRTIDIP